MKELNVKELTMKEVFVWKNKAGIYHAELDANDCYITIRVEVEEGHGYLRGKPFTGEKVSDD